MFAGTTVKSLSLARLSTFLPHDDKNITNPKTAKNL
jgi:hypothetical protein